MLQLPPLILDLAIILLSAGFIGIICKRLNQPVVLGYLLVGFIVGPYFTLYPSIIDVPNIRIWADLGVIFLLFALGLEFSFTKLRKVGSHAAIAGLFEVFLMICIGFTIGQMIGLGNTSSLFLGGVLSMSSTMVILKTYEDLNYKNKPFTQKVMGLLVIEDLVAIILLVLLSTLGVSKQVEGEKIFEVLLKLTFFLITWFAAGILILPGLLRSVARVVNEEIMLVVSLGLCFGMVVFASSVGFSPALGAFVMGSLLAETIEARRIEHLTTPLKNLFGAIFFVSIGMLINPEIIVDHWPLIFSLAAVVIFGKALFTTLGSLIAGVPLSHAVPIGLSLTQIGEFSFIIATLGVSLELIDESIYPITVIVSAMTTFATPYLLRQHKNLHNGIENLLPSHWLQVLRKYSSETKTMTKVSAGKALLQDFIVRIVLYTTSILALALIADYFLKPLLYKKLPSYSEWIPYGVITITLIVTAPFFWALVFGRMQTQSFTAKQLNRYRIFIWGLEVIRLGIALFILSMILIPITSVWWLLLALLLLAFALIALFSGKLAPIYNRIESKFLYNLNPKVAQEEKLIPLVGANWEGRTEVLKVSAFSPLAGKSLFEAKIRDKYGVTVFLIDRQGYHIYAPDRSTAMFPHDLISVVGTDKQIQRLRKDIESDSLGEESQSKDDYTFDSMYIYDDSPLLGMNVYDSKIRADYNALIIALERDNKKWVNPHPSTQLQIGDWVWLIVPSKFLPKLRGSKSRGSSGGMSYE